MVANLRLVKFLYSSYAVLRDAFYCLINVKIFVSLKIARRWAVLWETEDRILKHNVK